MDRDYPRRTVGTLREVVTRRMAGPPPGRLVPREGRGDGDGKDELVARSWMSLTSDLPGVELGDRARPSVATEDGVGPRRPASGASIHRPG